MLEYMVLNLLKFISFAEKIIEENLQVRDEFYISSVFDFYQR